jgi:hypothetical protein
MLKLFPHDHTGSCSYYSQRSGVYAPEKKESGAAILFGTVPAGTTIGFFVGAETIEEEPKGDLWWQASGYVDLFDAMGVLARRPSEKELGIHYCLIKIRRLIKTAQCCEMIPVLVQKVVDPERRELARLLGIRIMSIDEWIALGGAAENRDPQNIMSMAPLK